AGSRRRTSRREAMDSLKSTRDGIAAAKDYTHPELLIVDPAVEQVPVLLAGLRAGIEVVYLSPTGDALGQIARHLSARAPVATLHVLGHGEPGALRLAGERIDAAALARAPDDLA